MRRRADTQFLAFLAAAFCLGLRYLVGQVVTSRSVICAAYEDCLSDCRVDPELRRVEADQGASYGEFPVALREEHLVEGGKQPFPTEDAHNAEHRDESQGIHAPQKRRVRGWFRRVHAGEMPTERQQEERRNSHGGG